jgi:hypothetical protein
MATRSALFALLIGCSDLGSGETETDTDPGDDAAETADVDTGDGDGSAGDGDGADKLCPGSAARYIVLGDSVPRGLGVGGADAPRNGFRALHTHIESNHAAPGGTTSYENFAQDGATTEDVRTEQLPQIPVGMSGHAIVNVHVGGNDLSPFLFVSDEEAEEAFVPLLEGVAGDWDAIWAFFQSAENFPEGATVIVNTQFNPFDDCDAGGAFGGASISDLKTGLLHQLNDAAASSTLWQPNGRIADQHPGFLGHGHNFAQPQCPHYVEGHAYWMIGGPDFIHPAEEGHAGLLAVMRHAVDAAYSVAACGGG